MLTNRKSKFILTASTAVALIWCWTYFTSDSAISFWKKNDESTKAHEADIALPTTAASATEEKEVPATSAYVKNARSRIVMYNRAPKCGSRSFLSVIAELAVRNNFTDYTSHDYSHKRPRAEFMPSEVKQIADLRAPVIYNRHLLYTDFRKYGFQQPIYINLIRDPIDRFSSHYNYMKYGDNMGERDNPMTNWKDINVCVMQDHVVCKSNLPFYEGLFFCGMDNTCLIPSKKRVELAKKNLDNEYLLVGIMEEFDNTLALFEKMLPEYFAGATEIWRRNSSAKNSTASRTLDVLSDFSREKLRKFNLADEYELYYYAKEKFNRLKMKYGIK